MGGTRGWLWFRLAVRPATEQTRQGFDSPHLHRGNPKEITMKKFFWILRIAVYCIWTGRFTWGSAWYQGQALVDDYYPGYRPIEALKEDWSYI